MRVDQMDELVDRFGEQGQTFLRQVLGRLLEAATRDMDERCEFEDGLFAMILPGADKSNALAVAERLRSQVRQCKVRMGRDLWDLTASIGMAHCTVAARVMDIMLSAEAAMNEAARLGGDAVGVGQPVQEPVGSTSCTSHTGRRSIGQLCARRSRRPKNLENLLRRLVRPRVLRIIHCILHRSRCGRSEMIAIVISEMTESGPMQIDNFRPATFNPPNRMLLEAAYAAKLGFTILPRGRNSPSSIQRRQLEGSGIVCRP